MNKVLLIEDEQNIAEALRFILNRDGCAVDLHADGATAVSAVESRKPDMVILDVMLPNKSGFDILRDLRAHPELSETPVLMLTARGQEKDRQLAEEIGATEFMTKPFSNDEVLQTVRDILAR